MEDSAIGSARQKRLTDIIENCSLFKGLPGDQIEDIRRIALEKQFSSGDAIFAEGAEGKGFYVVAQGRVKIFKTSLEGKEQILRIFGPGEPFGEAPVFSGGIFPANAQAIEKSSLLFFPRKAFVSLVFGNPTLALNMLAVLSMRLHQFTVQVENLSLKEVPNRLAAYLLVLSREQKTHERVTLRISKGQLAGLLGTIPETLSRIFTKMSTRKLIEVDGRRIRLVDRDGLAELAKYGKLPES